MSDDNLTPSEDLMLEALIARHRTGEGLWTFESRHKKVAESLVQKGWVNLVHGIVEKSIRVSLTEAAIKKWVSPRYTPPFVKDIKKKRRKRYLK